MTGAHVSGVKVACSVLCDCGEINLVLVIGW